MNRNLQEKLFRFEAPPSEAAWEKITAALDSETSFAQRLFNYEAPPPQTVWPAVDAFLHQNHAKVIPFFTRYKRPLRYIAAASVVAVILTVATLNQRQVQAPPLVQRAAPSQPASTPPQNQASSTSQTVVKQQPPLAASSLSGRPTRGTFIKRTLAFVQPRNILPTFSLRKNFIPKQVPEKALVDQANAENFMVYSDGEGNVMRLPKKLFSLVCCQDGDGSCKVRLQRLRKTLSTNVAPTDFGGMIDMLRQLQ